MDDLPVPFERLKFHSLKMVANRDVYLEYQKFDQVFPKRLGGGTSVWCQREM